MALCALWLWLWQSGVVEWSERCLCALVRVFAPVTHTVSIYNVHTFTHTKYIHNLALAVEQSGLVL